MIRWSAFWAWFTGAQPAPPIKAVPPSWPHDDYPEDDDPTRDVKGRAQAAARELTETRRACAAIRKALVDKLTVCNPEETRKVDRWLASLQVLDAIRKALEHAVAAGQIDDLKALLDE